MNVSNSVTSTMCFWVFWAKQNSSTRKFFKFFSDSGESAILVPRTAKDVPQFLLVCLANKQRPPFVYKIRPLNANVDGTNLTKLNCKRNKTHKFLFFHFDISPQRPIWIFPLMSECHLQICQYLSQQMFCMLRLNCKNTPAHPGNSKWE